MPPTSPASIECAYALRCECTHLTSFGGVAIPTSLDDILAQLEPTITLPCPDGFFAPFIYKDSPLLYSLILGLTVLNLMSIAFFRFRYVRRSAGKELPWMRAFRKYVKKPVLTFLVKTFSNERILHISEGDLFVMRKMIFYTLAWSVIQFLGMLTAVGEIDRKLDPSKECFTAATEKLGSLAKAAPKAAPSVWAVPSWFMPAVPVPAVLCLLLLVAGSISSLKNPAGGGKIPLLVGAICALISFGFYLAVTCLLFDAARDVPEAEVQLYAKCLKDSQAMFAGSGIGCLVAAIACLGAFVSSLRAGRRISSSNKVVPGDEGAEKKPVLGGEEDALPYARSWFSNDAMYEINRDWYYAPGVEQLGPVSALELYTLRNSNALSDSALIWCPRLDQWTAYKDARREHTREIAEEMQKCQRKARKRGSIKAAKARQARVADALMMKGGAQMASPKLGDLYIDTYGFPSAKVLSAYPDLFPVSTTTFERVPVMERLETILKISGGHDQLLLKPPPTAAPASAPSPELMGREVPTAPPSPPEDSTAPDADTPSAPDAAVTSEATAPDEAAPKDDLTLEEDHPEAEAELPIKAETEQAQAGESSSAAAAVAPPAAGAAAEDFNGKKYSTAEREAAVKIQAIARGRFARMRLSTMSSPGAGDLTTMTDLVRAAKRAEEKRKLSERISESQAAQLWRAKNYAVLRVHLAYHAIKGVDKMETVAEVETRDRHSLVSLAAPNEVDEEDDRHLRDEQVSQIFFNCLVTELFVAATFNDTSTTTPPICVMNETHPRWAHLFANDTNATNATNATAEGIEGRMLGVKVAGEEGPDMTGMVCSGGGDIMVLTMIVTGMSEAVMLIITAIICRVMFRFGNKPIEEGQNIVLKFGIVKPKPWTRKQERLYHWRHAVAWMGNFIFFSVGLWYMSAIALCYGRKETDTMLEGWLTSTCISWFIMEPGFILLLVFLPCICNNQYVDTCNDRLNDIGCDVSMFIG